MIQKSANSIISYTNKYNKQKMMRIKQTSAIKLL